MKRLVQLIFAAVLTLSAAACQERPRPPGGTAPAPGPRTDDRGVLLLEGLGGDMAIAQHIQDAMGTREERAAHAPYSPTGWPLERGEIVTNERWDELSAEFPGWEGVASTFWVGTTVFGARWTGGGVQQREGRGFFEYDIRYVGHFPSKTSSEFWTYYIPDHLFEKSQTTAGFLEIADAVFSVRYSSFANLDEMELVWTEQAWLDGYTGEEENKQ